MNFSKTRGAICGAVLGILVVGMFVACGGSTEDVGVGAAVDILDLSGEDALAVARENAAWPNRVFAVDDFQSAGWKLSKQLDSEGLEGASEVWYGFFAQKDVELWIYATHGDAREHGASAAQAILEESRGVDVLNSIRGGTSVYSAYAVAGNVLMFCEEAVSCDGLVAALE